MTFAQGMFLAREARRFFKSKIVYPGINKVQEISLYEFKAFVISIVLFLTPGFIDVKLI